MDSLFFCHWVRPTAVLEDHLLGVGTEYWRKLNGLIGSGGGGLNDHPLVQINEHLKYRVLRIRAEVVGIPIESISTQL